LPTMIEPSAPAFSAIWRTGASIARRTAHAESDSAGVVALLAVACASATMTALMLGLRRL
ncbi:hypothetical protein FJV76_31780, partial [Mesorhizobium sp. WSM4303]|uniref:hypothetical protein n=1 Tax=unclassified Mesorhizobium TaxID=325217 RepID=UPI00115CFA04